MKPSEPMLQSKFIYKSAYHRADNIDSHQCYRGSCSKVFHICIKALGR